MIKVPTSSQRDQDEEVEEGVVVVDCDEGEGGGNHQAQEEEEFDNDPYEEIEEEEETYEVEVERDTNEVEIIMEEDSTSVEVPRQGQTSIPTNQQQSEAISSAGPTGEPPTSFTTRSRGIAPMPRQQQQQHLLLVFKTHLFVFVNFYEIYNHFVIFLLFSIKSHLRGTRMAVMTVLYQARLPCLFLVATVLAKLSARRKYLKAVLLLGIQQRLRQLL